MNNTTDNPVDNQTHVPWPTKPSPLGEVGALGDMSRAEYPDCDACPIFGPGLCTGYQPLKPDATRPPCKTYTTLTEWEQSINLT